MATCALSNPVLSSTSSSRSFSSSSSTKQPSSCCLVKSLYSPSFVRPVTALSAANGNSSQPGEAIQSQRSSRDSSLQQSRRPRETPLLLLDSWDPFSRGGLRQMMDTMDRLFFDDFAPSRSSGGRGAGNRSVGSSAGVRAPWDVIEDEEAYHIRVDMPGFTKEDVKVAVEDSVLVVTGQRDPSKEDARWAAKSYSKFSTRLALPDNAQFEKIRAELKNGVLTVNVPKMKPEDKKQVYNVEIA